MFNSYVHGVISVKVGQVDAGCIELKIFSDRSDTPVKLTLFPASREDSIIFADSLTMRGEKWVIK
jgi:hypothetical protein